MRPRNRLGHTVATYPWPTIILSWLVVLACCVGLLRFHNEKNPIKLWIPKGRPSFTLEVVEISAANAYFLDSKFIRDTEWIMKTVEIGYRTQSVLITADNVLTPEVMHKVGCN